MRTMVRVFATRAQGIGVARNTAPRLAGALLALAGALLAVTLPLAAMQGGVPLAPLLMWLSWMALFGAAAVAVMALRRVRHLEAALQRERGRFRALAAVIPAGVCWFDPTGDLTFGSAACEAPRTAAVAGAGRQGHLCCLADCGAERAANQGPGAPRPYAVSPSRMS